MPGTEPRRRRRHVLAVLESDVLVVVCQLASSLSCSSAALPGSAV